MNERIQQLAEQARKYARDYVADCKHYGHYMEHNELEVKFEEKFAELIVLEMCKELDEAQWDKGEDWICADGTRIIPQIKEHFGVEE
jgi:hypothetical protein